MKAEDLFKTKSEVASKLDELGIEYPKIKTGANKGNPTFFKINYIIVRPKYIHLDAK